jgi:hypothetical protein
MALTTVAGYGGLDVTTHKLQERKPGEWLSLSSHPYISCQCLPLTEHNQEPECKVACGGDPMGQLPETEQVGGRQGVYLLSQRGHPVQPCNALHLEVIHQSKDT